MYGEWHIISEVLQKDMQEGLTKMPFTDEQYRELGVNFFPNTMLTSLFVPLLVRVPVNSFEFHSCERTPQVEYLMR